MRQSPTAIQDNGNARIETYENQDMTIEEQAQQPSGNNHNVDGVIYNLQTNTSLSVKS